MINQYRQLFNKKIPTKTIVYYVFITMIDVLAMMSIPFLYKQILDVITNNETDAFLSYMGFLSILLIIHIFALIGKQLIANYTIINQMKNVRENILDHIQYTELVYVSSVHSGDIASRLSNDIEEIKKYLVLLSDILYQICVFVFAIVYGFVISIELLLATISIMVLAMFFNQFLSKPLTKFSHQLQKAYATLHTTVKDTIKGIKTVKAYQLEEKMIKTYEKTNQLITTQEKHLVTKKLFITMIQTILMVLPMQVINLYGGHLTFQGRITIGEFGLFLAIITYFIHPVSYFVALHANKKTANASKKRLEELMFPVNDQLEEVTLNKYQPLLEVSDVSFSYDQKQMVLKNLNLSLDEHSFHIILGESGSGKSTLFSLLSNLYKPTIGSISFYGADLTKLDTRKHIAVASQESYLYPTTILENIRIGLQEATKEDIIRAAKDARIHEFIISLKDGYDTVLLEDGQNLSGGQRQRISLARAFLKPAEILLLDEPTSALDQETSEAILQELQQRTSFQTILMITHQASHQQYADHAYILEDGCFHQDIYNEEQQNVQETRNLYCL